MSAMAYPAYDNFSRSLSRRQSLAYGSTPMTPYPYADQGMYGDPMMTGGEYPQPSYQIYGPPGSTMPMNQRLSPSYEDLPMRDSYFPDDRQMVAAPMVPHNAMIPMRPRRHSTVSFAARPPQLENYRRPSSINIKFKRKGSFAAGISLGEAQSHVRLSNNELYTLHDFHTDSRGRILLRIKWVGYSSLTYEIPLDSYDGRVSLQTLARRVARACVHYLQANIIPVSWDRVELHHLEEISYGTWQPMLSAR